MHSPSTSSRLIGTLVLGALVLAAPYAASAQSQALTVVDQGATPPAPFRSPYLPSRDDTVLQEVPAASSAKVRGMRQLRQALDKSPQDFSIAARLSRAYIDFGREIGDAHYAGYAEAVIVPWLKQGTPPVEAWVIHAVILQYQHQFDVARVALRKAIEREPNNAAAWLTFSTIDMTQGEYDRAAEDCAHISRVATTIALTCSATVSSFIGQAQRSSELMAILGARIKGDDPSIRAWITGLQGEIAGRLGEWDKQESYFKQALQYAPGDDFLSVAYADFLLDRNRPSEVLTLLAKQTQSDTAFLRIALAQQALGSPQLARYTWIMSARFEALALRDSALYDREQSRFVLHMLRDPERALTLAQGNWKMQRAPWDVRVFLEAALAANKPQAAAPVIAFLDKTHLQDPFIDALAKQVRARVVAKSVEKSVEQSTEKSR